ncbi:hypothetical protein GCM10007276_16650 [Agaricicola taiwanensis]|uniref:Uncharacterized protein n=1 Tax=Agaricicola taiwanensis TaxID=591372 RepID=A0A8J2YDI1_9RHOB|nr:DUF6111 family protein [Agaricicola taiwanensis]GGE39995.1 hypothetical protein GCM10007276_16650 [Agaricicola taiwanensis]
MLRVVLIQLALFLLPFAVFVLWRLLRRRQMRDGMNVKVLFFSAMAGAVLSIAFLIVFGQGDAAPPGARYVPPHMENGTYVPGRFLPPEDR